MVISQSRLIRKRTDIQEFGCSVPVYFYDAWHENYEEPIQSRIYDISQLDEASARFLVRVKRKLKALHRAQDPCVIKVLDNLAWMDGLLVSYEVFEGLTLRQIMKEFGKGLPIRHAVSIILNVARTVSRLHNRSNPILHLDLRPENVMLGRDWQRTGGTNHKLQGFTNPRVSPENITPAMSLGEFGDSFIAPEVREPSPYQRPDPSDDIYSVGALFRYCILGEQKYTNLLGRDENLATSISAHTNLSSLIQQAIAPNRRDRFRNIDEFIEILGAQAIAPRH